MSARSWLAPTLASSPDRMSPKTILVAAFVILGIALSAPYFPERFSDARAFYCAGQAVRQHADPYREHPLNDCERRVTAPGLSPLRDGATVPAPFPGFVLALFALIALLPFGSALALWIAASCVAIWLAVVLVARVTNTHIVAGAILLGFPAVTVALPLGQVTPFVLLALAAAAALLKAERPAWAGLAAIGTMLDPHVGCAVLLGIGVAVPAARRTVIGGVLGLVALSLAVSGVGNESEYLREVLPAHALANMSDGTQFSTTNLAYVAGASSRAALALGTIWYIVALGLGTIVAVRGRARLGAPAAVLIPPAFAVFGGMHTHLAQLALAIPAFLLVYARTRDRQRLVFAAIMFVAAMPWLQIGAFPLLSPAAAVLAFVFARKVHGERHALRCGAATFVLLIAIFIAIVRSHVARAGITVHVDGNPLADVSWQIAVLARNAPPEPWYLFAKAPTMIAFVLFLIVLVRVALQRTPRVREC
jgi:hypothetical protein